MDGVAGDRMGMDRMEGKTYFWKGPSVTHPPPAPAGIQFNPVGRAFVQLCSSYTPLPPILVVEPSNIGALIGSSAVLPQFQYCHIPSASDRFHEGRQGRGPSLLVASFDSRIRS